MKKMLLNQWTKHALFIVACVMAFSSCKKDEDTGTSNGGSSNGGTKTRAEQLAAYKWKITNATTSPPINGSTDYYNAFMRACDRDNIFTFDTKNGKLIIDEKADVCSENKDKPIRNLDLTLSDPKTPTSFTVGQGDVNVGGYTHKIASWIDNKEFSTIVNGDFGGFKFSITYYFVKQ